MGAQQVGKHGSRCRGVGEGVVMVGQRNSIAGTQLGQAVGELAIWVELPGEIEGAHPSSDYERDAGTPSGLLDELGVEVDVVGGEHAAIEAPG